MKILIDECVDWRLLRDFPDDDVRTVKQLGWEHLDDRILLTLAAQQFDVFVTVDKDLPNEVDVQQFDIAVVVLRARTTRLADLRALLPRLRDAVQRATAGALHVISWRDLPPR